jgi:hypothetical protein
LSLLGRVRQWWHAGRPELAAGDRFSVSCFCGHVVAGKRSHRHQLVPCPACGAEVFVLPTNPWLSAVARDPRESVQRSLGSGPLVVPAGRDSRWWWMPVAAAASTLAVVALAFSIFLPLLGRPASVVIRQSPEGLQDVSESGRRALAEGNYFLAERQLAVAIGTRCESRTAAELRQLDQLRRQADLLARLHGRSLQEVLSEALPLRSDDEWRERFRAEHLGKAVVFDDVVARDGTGRPVLAVYRVRVGNEKARVALEDFRLLKVLPLDPPCRLLFGGRLADLARESGGGWAFHFEPNSGVLLTDSGAVTACLGPPDTDLLEVLRRQQQWIADLPGQAETR